MKEKIISKALLYVSDMKTDRVSILCCLRQRRDSFKNVSAFRFVRRGRSQEFAACSSPAPFSVNATFTTCNQVQSFAPANSDSGREVYLVNNFR